MGSIETDSSRLPLLVIRFTGVVDDVAFDRYLEQTRERATSGKRYAVLADATNAGVATAPQRKRQADFIKAHRELLAHVCVGNAFVIPNPLVRGVLTAILWLQPLPYDHVVVNGVADGEAWCRKRLAAAGL